MERVVTGLLMFAGIIHLSSMSGVPGEVYLRSTSAQAL
jgi:hypothetical protein